MHDVLIAGGGPVGAALALCLRDSGLDVTLIDAPERRDEDLRPIALSHASRLIIDRLIPQYVADAATQIRSVHVSQQHGFGRTLIREADLEVAALGYVFDLGELSRKLRAEVSSPQMRGRVVRWEGDEDKAQAHILGDRETTTAEARLLVIADGGQWAGDDLALRDYGQSAIVALVCSEEPPEGGAWERFCSTGPLALLPLRDRYALVWTTTTAHARQLGALNDAHFLEALQDAFGQRLGRFTQSGPRSAFPLQLRFRASPIAGQRCLNIGNAAQTLHPVAGQGLNLGLRDAFELAQLLKATAKAKIGDGNFLQIYAAARDSDRKASIVGTDSLVRLFSNNMPALRPMRGVALAALDLIPPLRRVFARRMVYGLRNLP